MSDINKEGNGLYDDFKRDQNLKPHPIQESLVELPDNVFEALYGGAAYGGKSWILTLLPLFRGWYKYPGFKGIIFRRKFPDLEREIIRLSRIYFPSTGAVYNEQKHSWYWPAYQSYFDFGHVQHDHNIEDYDSAQYNYCGFDELTHFTAYPYHYMVGSRIRPSSSFNLALVRNGTNPGGVGQTWVFNRFVKPCEEGHKILRDSATGLTRVFIPAKAEDNPYGMEYDPLYVKKLEILAKVSEADYKAKRFGDWHAFKGSVFTTFRPIKFPGEPDNALHVIEPFTIPEWWPRILTIDWGKRAMCYALWGAISPDKRVYAYRERAWYGKDIPFWGTEIRDIHDENNETVIQMVLCGSAWQNRGSETIADQVRQYTNIVPTSSENTSGSRVATLHIVHDFLRFEKRNNLKTKESFYDLAKAQGIYRQYGPDALERYRAQFLDEPEEVNLPILQIFNTCKVLIETIPIAQYAEGIKGRSSEDIEEFEGDDPLDDLRYFCKTAKRYINGEVGNINAQLARQQVLDAYQVNNDMTSLYRQLERLEKDDLASMNSHVAVSRRSRFARRRG